MQQLVALGFHMCDQILNSRPIYVEKYLMIFISTWDWRDNTRAWWTPWDDVESSWTLTVLNSGLSYVDWVQCEVCNLITAGWCRSDSINCIYIGNILTYSCCRAIKWLMFLAVTDKMWRQGLRVSSYLPWERCWSGSCCWDLCGGRSSGSNLSALECCSDTVGWSSWSTGKQTQRKNIRKQN